LRVLTAGARSASHSAFTLSRKQMSCEMACEHLTWLQARARTPPPPPPAADSSDDDSDDDEDGDSERDRMIADAAREMGGTVKSSSSSAAAAANAAANSQRVQLAMMSAAFSVLLGSVTALAHCWAAGAVEDVKDGMALFTVRGRRLLATGSKRDPARLEALSVASLNEMLARRPAFDAHYASGKTRCKQWTGVETPDSDDTLRAMLRMFFGDSLFGDEDGDADGPPKKDKEEAPPPRISFDPKEARDYLNGRWREGPTWADVQPLVVGYLDDVELKKLAANAQICSRLPSAKRRKDSITGT
jgi:hypothetical protein